MRLLLPALVSLLLGTACGPDGNLFGGEDIGALDAEDTGLDNFDPASARTFMITDVDQTCDSEAGEGMAAQVESGDVRVVHSGHSGPTCAVFEVSGDLTDSVITLEYDDVSGEACPEDCPWTLIYTLEDIPPGDYTLDIEGHTELFTVPE